MLTCSTLRGATLGSLFLLLAAWLVEFLIPNSVTASYVSLFLILGAALLLALLFILSILPGAARRLDECEH